MPSVGESKVNIEDTRLGTLLLETSIVSETDLQHCLELQSLTEGRWPLGQILIEQGVLTQATLEEFLTVQRALRGRQQREAVQLGSRPSDRGFLARAVEMGANDLLLSEGRVPVVRIGGDMVRLAEEPLAGPELWTFVRTQMGIDVLEQVAEHQSVTMPLPEGSGTRGRVTAFRHFDGLGIAARLHPEPVRTPDAAGLDPSVAELMRTGRGLVLIAGESGAGVTETFATLLHAAATVPERSVLVLDRDFEYPVPSTDAVVVRRRVGGDTRTWTTGIRAALREEPDVLFVGEVDARAIDLVVHAAESGALVVAGVRAGSGIAALSRAVSFHPEHDQARVRSSLASALIAVLGVRLLPAHDRSSLVLATELLMFDEAVRDLVRTGTLQRIRALQRIGGDGHDLDTSLMRLVHAGRVRFEDAFACAQDKTMMLEARRQREGAKS